MVTQKELDQALLERDMAKAILEEQAGSTTARIAAVIASTSGQDKDGQNTHQNYAYRSYEGAVGILRRAMATHGLVCLPNVIELQTEERKTQAGKPASRVLVCVRYDFMGPDPTDVVSATTWGEGIDQSDKAVNKALTAAHKYALMQTFMLATDADDTDASSPEFGQVVDPTGQQDAIAQALGFRHDSERQTAYQDLIQLRSELTDEQRERAGTWIAAQNWPPFQRWGQEHFAAASDAIDDIQRNPEPSDRVKSGTVEGEEPF